MSNTQLFSLPTLSEDSTIFQLKTMASDLEVLILILILHTHLQTTQVQAGGHHLMKPREPQHLLKPEMRS